MEVDKSKLTFIGSMNYIVQVHRHKGTKICLVDQYQPIRNRIWSGEMPEEDTIPQIEETIERMKICINLMEEFLEGKRDEICFWQEDDEDR